MALPTSAQEGGEVSSQWQRLARLRHTAHDHAGLQNKKQKRFTDTVPVMDGGHRPKR